MSYLMGGEKGETPGARRLSQNDLARNSPGGR